MSEDDCATFLENIGEVISRIKDNNANYSRVAIVEFTNDEPNVLIDFDSEFQGDVRMMINKVRNDGDCSAGNGDTDTLKSILIAVDQFMDDMRNKKIIIVSGCRDTINDIGAFCQDPDGKEKFLDENDIDVYVVNLQRVSSQMNNIVNASIANEYLLCLVDHPNRVCIGDEQEGVNDGEWHIIIEDCLLPGICIPPTESPTIEPTSDPTPHPSKNPSTKPTKWPTRPPTVKPTDWPTRRPPQKPRTRRKKPY